MLGNSYVCSVCFGKKNITMVNACFICQECLEKVNERVENSTKAILAKMAEEQERYIKSQPVEKKPENYVM
jgi:hypothetical protein